MTKYVIIAFGIASLSFMFYLLEFKKKQFDSSLLGLFTIGIGLVVYSILDPASLKIGNLEIIQKAKQATSEAEKAAKLANETVSMLLWNNGRWGTKTRTDEAKKVLTNIYGKKEANRKIQKFVEAGLFEVDDDEKRKILNEKIEFSSEPSPLYDLLIKNKDKK